jgi:4-amino-4-deoxy-L-arabinose transferase-like glycosyltransferase
VAHGPSDVNLTPIPQPVSSKKPNAAGVPLALLGFAIVVAAIIAHVYGLATLPRGFYVDESSIAYNAYRIAQAGHDEHGVAWPLYFKAFGEYKNPLYIYALALFYRLIGYSELMTRLLSAGCWLAGAAVTYRLGHRLFTEATCRLYLLLCLGFTPWLFSVSRIAFEVIAVFPVVAFFLLATFHAYEEKSRHWALAAGAAIGISLYAYSTFRLLAPLLAIAAIASYPQRRYARVHLWFVAGAALASVPYLAYFATHPHDLTQRFALLTYLHRDDVGLLDKAAMFAQRYLGYFGPGFLAIVGDPERRHHTGFGGELLLPTYALLVLGVIALVASGETKRSPFTRFLLLSLLISPLAAALTIDPHHSLRTLSMVVFAILLSTYGVRYAGRWRLSGALVALTAINAALYTTDYFRRYPAESAVAFENYGFREALLAARDRAHGRIVVSAAGNQPYINVLFFDSVLPDARRIPVVLGREEDVRSGDVFVFPLAPAELPDLRRAVDGGLYAARDYSP